jgi:hypothetical protein
MISSNRVALFLLGTVLSACGGGAAGQPASSSAGASPSGTTDALATGNVGGRVDLKSAVEAALADAARRTGRKSSKPRVISAEALVWPDGSLGCAEPGVSYTMAPVPGYRIVIDAGGEKLDYRASDGGYLTLCPAGRGGAAGSNWGTK